MSRTESQQNTDQAKELIGSFLAWALRAKTTLWYELTRRARRHVKSYRGY